MISKKGFTLIELLVVVAIIGVLATIFVAKISDARSRARNAAIVSSLSSLDAAIDMDKYPGSLSGLCLDFESGGEFEDIRTSVEDSGGIWNCDSTFGDYRIFVKLNQSVIASTSFSKTAYADSTAHSFGNFYCLNSDLRKNFTHWSGDHLAYPSCNDDDYINTPVDPEENPDPTPDPEPETDPDPPAENGGGSCASPKAQVCHYDKTLCISSKALKGHKKHGDVEGSC